MLYKQKGYPEEGELVLCRVTKIFPNSVFAQMVEYNDSGMIHISEIAPGRIRNLREYVKIGKQIVCVVLRVKKDRGHIDLSLRRVGTGARLKKLDEIKQELKAEQIIAKLAKRLNQKTEDLYKKVSEIIFKEYPLLHLAFKDVVSGHTNFEDLGFDSKLSKDLFGAVKEKFKEPIATFRGEIELHTYASNGVEKVKKTLRKIADLRSGMQVVYLGAGKYKFTFTDKEIKTAEKDISAIEKILGKFQDKLSTFTFNREKADFDAS